MKNNTKVRFIWQFDRTMQSLTIGNRDYFRCFGPAPAVESHSLGKEDFLEGEPLSSLGF
jgi:hypothetical protein